MTETCILLARHGATTANLKRPYVLQGQGVNHELDPLGVKQAEALSQHLAEHSISAVYASPLLRASQTAAIAARPHRLQPVLLPELQEANAGLWEGKCWHDVQQHWPKEQAAHDEDPGLHGYPGGETFCDVRDRAAPVLLDLANHHLGQTILVVAHNVVNRALVAHWTGIPIKYSRRIPQNNAAYNVLLWTGENIKVRTINASQHLAGLIPPD